MSIRFERHRELSAERTWDTLSVICSSLTVKNLVSGQLHADGPWAMQVPGDEELTLGASLKGAYWITVEGIDDPLFIDEGDCYLIGNGRSMRISNAADIEAIAYDVAIEQTDEERHRLPTEAAPHDVGEHVSVGSRFAFDLASTNPIFDLLPPVIHMRAKTEAASVLGSVLKILSNEINDPRPGGLVMIDHLIQIALVQALRAYFSSADSSHGWLGALVDKRIGAALALMHRDIARRWTMNELAAEVGMSRSSFASHFKSLVGLSPLEYSLHWRMRHAGHLLRKSSRTVAAISLNLGYESDKSFGKAFKRVMGLSPRDFRREGSAPVERTSSK